MDFSRISPSVDVDTAQQKHVTMIGGAYNLVADCVRSGVGSISLCDFDRIDVTNPQRQDFNPGDANKYKVDVWADTLRQINPEIDVEAYPVDYCSLTEQQHDELFGHTDLFIFATDHFPAQARGNREILRLNKPAVWIGIYRDGRAGEIIYYVPGLTSACYRCICGGRYEAFATGGAKITSTGGTIFDLRLVDAIAGPIAMSILTQGANNRFGKIVGQLGNRNLLQVKMDPDYRLGDKDIFSNYLGDDPANFSFTTIALAMEQEPDCPDCTSILNENNEGVETAWLESSNDI